MIARRILGWGVAQSYRAIGARAGRLRTWLASGNILPVVFHDARPYEVRACLAWLFAHGATPANLEVTFDDGWIAFAGTVGVLEEFGVKATLFVAPGETARGNVWTNEAMAAGVPFAEWSRWYGLSASEREARLTARTGGLTARKLLDESEIRAIARHPLVALGNHSWSHPSCPHRPVGEILDEIDRAQETLTRWAGRAPTAFAYPFGRGTDALDAAVRARGLTPYYTRQGLVTRETLGAARNGFVEGMTLAENVGRILCAWPKVGVTR